MEGAKVGEMTFYSRDMNFPLDKFSSIFCCVKSLQASFIFQAHFLTFFLAFAEFLTVVVSFKTIIE